MALQSPELTSDPLGFFANYLSRSLLFESVEERESDIYFIRSVIERVKRAREHERSATERIESPLESIRDAIRRSEYHEAVRAAVDIDKTALTPEQLREFVDGMWSTALRLSDDSKEELSAYDQVITGGDVLLKEGKNESPLREQVARALGNKGVVLDRLQQHEAAIAVYDDVIRRFGEAPEPALREAVAKARQGLQFLHVQTP
jgi:hypothetical protein